jgi:hypothetical protein
MDKLDEVIPVSQNLVNRKQWTTRSEGPTSSAPPPGGGTAHFGSHCFNRRIVFIYKPILEISLSESDLMGFYGHSIDEYEISILQIRLIPFISLYLTVQCLIPCLITKWCCVRCRLAVSFSSHHCENIILTLNVTVTLYGTSAVRV